MVRVLTFLIAVAALALAAAWLADHPGAVVLDWQGWRIETSVMVLAGAVLIVIALGIFLWSVLRIVAHGPEHMADFFRARRRDKGLRAISRGMIAVGAGDERQALHHAREARKLMRREPLTLLLEAQSAQLAGDRDAARKAFEAMLESPETELLGLRGLFVEAKRAGDADAARLFADRAAAISPGLPWAAGAMLEFQTRDGDWEAALLTVRRNADNRLMTKQDAARARAVLLTAQALEREEDEPEGAQALALEAHKLAPELVPAAVVAARQAAATGNTRQATRIAEKTWKLNPHPDIAEVYAHARPGDSARDRLKRARTLAQKVPNHPESRIAVAVAAIEAQEWAAARGALTPLMHAPTQRVCLLMADIEEGEHGDMGRVREWLARAVRAARDPAWTADGWVSEHWAPVSPVTGRLDAFEWKVPVEAIGGPDEMDLPAEPEPAPTPALVVTRAEPKPEPRTEAAPSPPPAVIEAEPETAAEHPVEPKTEPQRAAPADEKPVRPVKEPEPKPAAAKPAPRPVPVPPQPRPKPVVEADGEANVIFPRPPDDPGPDAAIEDEPTPQARSLP